MLAERAIDPPAGAVKLQIARLNDAMRVAHVRMIGGGLQAIDRLVKLVGERDRYHGFGRAHAASALEAPPAAPLRIAATPRATHAPRPVLAEGKSEIFLPASA
jgi:hypothetical protein